MANLGSIPQESFNGDTLFQEYVFIQAPCFHTLGSCQWEKETVDNVGNQLKCVHFNDVELTFSFHAHSPIPRNAIPKNQNMTLKPNMKYLMQQLTSGPL